MNGKNIKLAQDLDKHIKKIVMDLEINGKAFM